MTFVPRIAYQIIIAEHMMIKNMLEVRLIQNMTVMYTAWPTTQVIGHKSSMIYHHLNIKAEVSMSAYELFTSFFGWFNRYVGAVNGSNTIRKF